MGSMDEGLLDASDVKERSAWVERLREIGQENGHYRDIGPDHQEIFLRNGRTLLVTFDLHDFAVHRPRRLPVGMDLADECDWSHLCLMARHQPWFRDPAVYAHMDELIDQGFFEDFDRVLFYGAGALSHPAAAYSVASPGARVLLVNPIATLAPRLAGWDGRYRGARRLDFTSRYGFAPDMIEGAASVDVLYDPARAEDAMQAALFRGPHVRLHAARLGGDELEAMFGRMGQLNALIAAAMEEGLSPSRFGAIWRNRRSDNIYLRNLQMATIEHPAREIMVCRNVVARLDQKRFRRRLADLTGAPISDPEG